MLLIKNVVAALAAIGVAACSYAGVLKDPELEYKKYTPTEHDRVISRDAYLDKLQGFWLAQSIANWTGLATEMDRVEPPFYTDEHWGQPDQKNIWGLYVPGRNEINFHLVYEGQPWGADDDTDIEYIYQHLLDVHNTSKLTGEQIQKGWLKHIYTNEEAPLYQKFEYSVPEKENFLWESNEVAYYLMKDGVVPPETSDPEKNKKSRMIDAQLTTEFFGLLAPARPDIALDIAHLPIRTTAYNESEWISEFYVIMHSLASYTDESRSMKEQVFWMAEQARKRIPENTYVASMYDFVKRSYEKNSNKDNWEKTRNQVYKRYQKQQKDGYTYVAPFDAGINFAASLVSLFYGEGDMIKTLKIGTLAGWDSDNPTATWGGLYGFMLGKKGVEKAFKHDKLSDTYWIHRTRRNFPDHTPKQKGEDSFNKMAERGVLIIDRVVLEEIGGGVDLDKGFWYIPDRQAKFEKAKIK